MREIRGVVILFVSLFFTGCEIAPPRTYTELQIGMPEAALQTACSSLQRGDFNIEAGGTWYWVGCLRGNERVASVYVVNGVIKKMSIP